MSLKGITTDGSSLYPAILMRSSAKSLALCTFLCSKEMTKAVLGAVAKLHGTTGGQQAPKVAAGPSRLEGGASAARRKKRIERKIEEKRTIRAPLLPVRPAPSRRLPNARPWRGSTRGQPQLRTLRGLMEEVYRLFDRRCRTATALAKLARLRTRLRRFVRWGGAQEVVLAGLGEGGNYP